MSLQLTARLALLAYLLLATLLHPCLCHATAAAAAVAAAPVDRGAAGNWRTDPKAIDQGVAYVLMLLALFITYIVH